MEMLLHVDHYHTSRNIVTTGFSGVLRGESMDNAIIHAARKSATDGDGFAPAFSPWWWSQGSAIRELATVLQFDNASGSVTITDLTVETKDDQPTDLTIDYYGNPATYITTLIEILGGEHDTRIENVRVEGKETGAAGNLRPKYGPWSWWCRAARIRPCRFLCRRVLGAPWPLCCAA